MPWCDECSRFFAPTALTSEGRCPACGRQVGDPPTAPWHFKLLLVGVVLYLGWRAVQGIAWLAERI